MRNSDSSLDRRGFLRSSAMAAAAATAEAAGEMPEGQDRKTVRAGFVGVGRRGTHLLDTFLQLEHVAVPAVCDVVPAHAARAQDKAEQVTGVRPEAYTDGERAWEALVARDDLDAVINATPWEWHALVSVASMRAGKYAGSEVPAALTLDECWALVDAYEETGTPCMMLENVCYFENALTLLRMVREGLFGELLHAEAGYQHDCRFLMFHDDGSLTWRGEYMARANGNQYPTHPIGPVAQWFGINRGDRFTRLTSTSSAALGARRYAAAKFGPDHPAAKRDYAQGDVNTCLIETERGRTVTLYYDMTSPRPYDLILRLQGVEGICMGSREAVYLEGMSPKHDTYEAFGPYKERCAHPLWRQLQERAVASGGHGGADYITLYEFVKAVRNRTEPPQDVYDAAAWSAIVPLSVQSVAENQKVAFPDFTRGKWRERAPLPVYGA